MSDRKKVSRMTIEDAIEYTESKADELWGIAESWDTTLRNYNERQCIPGAEWAIRECRDDFGKRAVKYTQLSDLLREYKECMGMRDDRPYLVELIGIPAAFELLAEECTELAKAALKKARILRGENPTPMTHKEASRALNEEFTDVMTVAEELDLTPDRDLQRLKKRRLCDRVRAKNDHVHG